MVIKYNVVAQSPVESYGYHQNCVRCTWIESERIVRIDSFRAGQDEKFHHLLFTYDRIWQRITKHIWRAGIVFCDCWCWSKEFYGKWNKNSRLSYLFFCYSIWVRSMDGLWMGWWEKWLNASLKLHCSAYFSSIQYAIVAGNHDDEWLVKSDRKSKICEIIFMCVLRSLCALEGFEFERFQLLKH